jgi:hypothetical protein
MSALKLVARLRRHDWTAAIIELLIVVVGILVALQLNNWNQDRLDHSRADSYYRRIHAELLADRQNIDNTLKFWNVVSNYGRAAIAFGESGQRMDGSNWKTVLAYYQASQLMPFELEDTVFTEMRDGGGLALINDEGLRKRLADYYRISGTGITANILHHDPVYRMQVRGLTPWRVQQYIWDKCFRALGGTNQELIDCPSPIGEQEAATLLESYRQSDSLLQNLRFWISTLRVGSIVLDSTRKDAVNLAAEVEAARKQ